MGTEEEREDVEKKVGEALDENFQVLQEKKEMREKRAESTEEETEDESAEGEEEKETAEKKPEKDVEREKDSAMETEESEKEKTEEGSQDEKETKDEESVGDGDVDAKEGKDKQEQEAEEEEDPSNLQLSWEMLELAKVAYTNKLAATADEEKLVEMKICEVLLTLGEVSLESETYEQAVADITECLTKRKVLHEADSRRIAETHYHLGVALGHFNKFDEAVSALQSAIDCIKLRIENLKNKKESKDESKADDAFYTREAEITELEALLPEIEEKIQDTKDMKEQSKESQAEESTGFANGDNKAAKPISTISVKRKAEGADNASPKKAHLENGDKN